MISISFQTRKHHQRKEGITLNGVPSYTKPMDRSLHQGKQYQYRFINRTASKLSCPEIVLMLNSSLNINQEFCQVPSSSDGHLGSYAQMRIIYFWPKL
ncbi:unnamed protein product [Rhizophagus irregularis]|nr:unnamed protein product [Rhizophagus irregularis]